MPKKLPPLVALVRKWREAARPRPEGPSATTMEINQARREVYRECANDLAKLLAEAEASAPKRIVNVMRIREWEHDAWQDSFAVADFVTDVEKALRAAVAEFLKSPAAKAAFHEQNGFFNWGDAMTYVPAALWEKHGLTPLPHVAADPLHVRLDQDEDLRSATEKGDC